MDNYEKLLTLMCLLVLSIASVMKDDGFNSEALVDVFLIVPLLPLPFKLYEKYQSMKKLYLSLQQHIKSRKSSRSSDTQMEVKDT